MDRQFFVLTHRYVGLVMTLFLVIASFTGIFLAFYNELDGWINSGMAYVQKPSADAKRIDPFALREILVKRYPFSNFQRVEFTQHAADKSIVFYFDPKINPATQKPYAFENDQIYVNPYTGETVGARKWGAISQGVKNLMPFVYELHYSLALGKIGRYALGFIALLWTLDCFVGAYLTFPQKQKRRSHTQSLPHWARVVDWSSERKGWLNRWWKAWKVRWTGGFYKVNFDLHRAGGLWLWAMLFVFAWSSVAFNLQEVYHPVTNALFESQQRLEDLPKLEKSRTQPLLDYRQAYVVAKSLALQEAHKNHFSILGENNLNYDNAYGMYEYRFRTDLDVSEKYGQTSIYFDGNTGKQILIHLPTGKASGDTITQWILQLHMAGLWGFPMQVFVSLMGLVLTGLSITGVYIWHKKRKANIKAIKIVSSHAHKVNMV